MTTLLDAQEDLRVAWRTFVDALKEATARDLRRLATWGHGRLDRLEDLADVIDPPPPAFDLSDWAARFGETMRAAVGWMAANPSALRLALEVESMKAKAAALGASVYFVDNLVAIAMEEAKGMGADPLVVLRRNWADAYARLAMGMTEGQAAMAARMEAP